MRRDSSHSGESFRALPKAEVHVHLEGCFEPATLESWARQAGVPMPRERDRLFAFNGLADFLEFLRLRCDLGQASFRLASIPAAWFSQSPGLKRLFCV